MLIRNPFKGNRRPTQTLGESLATLMGDDAADLLSRLTDEEKIAPIYDLSGLDSEDIEKLDTKKIAELKKEAHEAIADWAEENLEKKSREEAEEYASHPDFRYENDGSVTFVGTWGIGNARLETLPPGIGKVEGTLWAMGNRFTDFKSFPRVITGSLGVSQCKFNSWEGFPKVGGDVNLNSNELTSLVGSPRRVKGYLNLTSNAISDLTGAPDEIGGSLALFGNPLFFEGDGAKKFPAGMKVSGKIQISRRQITTDAGEIATFLREMSNCGLEVEIL